MENEGGFLDDILEEIENSPELNLFFKKLLEGQSTLAKLFFLHRDELFLSSESVTPPTILPCLFWTNVPSRETKASNLRILSFMAELDKMKSDQASKIFSYLLEGIIDDVKDLIMYYLIMFVRNNKDIQTLIESEDFNFRKMKHALKDYKAIKFELPQGLDLKDRDLQLKIKKLGKEFEGLVDDIRKNPIEIVEILPYLLPDFYMSFHVSAQKHIANLCKSTGLSISEYKFIISDLYMLKLIQCQHTVFWCQHCQDEPQILKTTSEISPNYLKMKCLRCGKQMSISSVYRIHDLLEECLLSKDGLLSVATAWLLEQKGIVYETSVYGKKYEYDFMCTTPKGKILLECKVHRTPISDRSVRGQLEEDLQQLTRHAKELKVQEGIIVYNYSLEKYADIVKEMSQKYGGMAVIDYVNLSDFVDSLKTT